MTDRYDLSRFGLSYAGADPKQLEAMNALMDHNPVASQKPRDGTWDDNWGERPERPDVQGDRSTIQPISEWRARTIAGAAHPPLECIVEDAHEDVIRRFHLEPAVKAEKRRLMENKARLLADSAKWWGNNDG